MISYIILGIIFASFTYFAFQLIVDIECANRAIYWNDNGIFIDSWDYSPFECDYPPIKPVEEFNIWDYADLT